MTAWSLFFLLLVMLCLGRGRRKKRVGGGGSQEMALYVCGVCIHSVRRGEVQQRNETTMRGGIRAVQYTVRGLLGEVVGEGRGVVL